MSFSVLGDTHTLEMGQDPAETSTESEDANIAKSVDGRLRLTCALFRRMEMRSRRMWAHVYNQSLIKLRQTVCCKFKIGYVVSIRPMREIQQYVAPPLKKKRKKREEKRREGKREGERKEIYSS